MLRVGLIGCGERGEGCCTAIAKTSNTRLAMTMDTNQALAQDLGQRFGVPWTTRFEDVLEDDRVDAVVISTPHHLHAPQAVRAAQAGKHVIVEKPISTSLREAIAATDAARHAGVQLSVNLSYRYLPHFQKARLLIESGVLGELFGVSLIYQRDRDFDYWHGSGGRSTSDWRTRWETSGGGILINSVIHFIDLLRYLPGREVVEVSAAHTTLDSPGEVEDTASLWVRYDNGALGTINASSCVRGADLLEFRLWGRDGHVSLTPPCQFYSARLVDGKRPGQWHEFSGIRGVTSRDVEYFQRFTDGVLRGRGPDITGEDGLAAQAIVEAAYRSAQTRQTVRVERGPWGPEES